MTKFIQNLRYDTLSATDFFARRLAYTLGPVELQEMMKENKIKLIDVRYREDFEESHIEGAIHIEKSELKEKLHTLSEGDVHVIYCYNQQCHLGAAAAFILAQNGYPVMELEGGFKTWKEEFKMPTT